MRSLADFKNPMCFSASVSYGTAALLVPTGLYAALQATSLRSPYWMIALAPVFFGIQQGIEGRVWQVVEVGASSSAVSLALAFHFFSHFLWLWWIPLSSWLIEPSAVRKRVFFGVAVFGGLAGGTVYLAMLLNPHWLSVEVEQHSIVYNVSSTYEIPLPVDIPLPASALYGLIILVPLLFSSHAHVRTFGMLVALSIALASAMYGYAFVSVWCFFAAVLSLYLVLMIRQLTSQREAVT